MSTLTQYWIDEAGRLDQALGAVRTDTGIARLAQAAAQTQSRLAADAVRVASDTVAVARKALAGIPTPADGDPLLLAMSNALVAWHEALHAQAGADLALQSTKAAISSCPIFSQLFCLAALARVCGRCRAPCIPSSSSVSSMGRTRASWARRCSG